MASISLGLLVAALLLAAPASAMEVGGFEKDVSVEGESLEVDTPDTDVPVAVDAGAEGRVETGDLDMNVKGPTCKVGTTTDSIDQSECERGSVGADTTGPSLDYEVRVRFGNLDAANGDGASDGGEVETAGAQTAAAPTVPTGVVIAAAAAGASGLLAYGLTRFFRTVGFLGLVPLYSTIKDEDLLKDENRSRIFNLIEGEPGISTKDVADRLDLAWGTVTHHLNKLERRRLIVSKKYGKYRRYFVNGAASGHTKDAVAVLKVPRTSEIAEFVRANPGVTQKEVSDAIGVSSSTILWHVKRLERVGLVRKVRDGKTVHYYAGEQLNQMDVIAPANGGVASPA